jgi:peptidoglycan/xylan/chitin deacetylase (PgdA/CDA1 family)
MLADKIIYGSALPEKTLCFTFDDGPGRSSSRKFGPHTIEVAKYLKEEGIVATFFMVGKFVKSYPDIVREVKKLGHIIGSHTYSHPDMNKEFNKGKNLVSELTKTENLLKEFVDDNTIYFRPPFGRWNIPLSEQLNSELTTNLEYKGPIGWQIDGSDWYYWSSRDKDRAAKCAANYLKLIRSEGKGIILMHDSSANRNFIWAFIRQRYNQSLELLKIIVPELKKEGYSFVGLNEIQFEN